MNQIPTKIAAGKFGNGNTDILKAIITRRHLSFQYCADCNIVLPRMRSIPQRLDMSRFTL
jgi:hypothetical protein